jgi:beta-phosphoglucomutase
MNQTVRHFLELPSLELAEKPITAASDHKNHLIYSDWVLIERGFDPQLVQSRESVFTIGNGYLGTRGCFEEGYPRSLPVTLVHGVYDAVPVVYTELVNFPDWLPLTISLSGDPNGRRMERFRLDQGEVLFYERRLDLRYGSLHRTMRWRSPNGRTIEIQLERFASLADPHVLGLRCLITPIDWAGTILVHASINGYTENQGFNHWEFFNQSQPDVEATGNSASQSPQNIWLSAKTRQSRVEMGMAASLMVQGVAATFTMESAPGYPTLMASYNAQPGETVLVEKMVTVYTSRDTIDPLTAAQTKLADLPGYPTCWEQHQQKWDEAWQGSDIIIEGDTQAQLAARYNIFQLLISAPWWDHHASIPAKTLSGFGYRGHIFWDTEIFMLPLFIFTQPELARHLLTYRYHTLEGARRKARSYGYKGAMYAWESADMGDEVTPRWALPTDPYASDIRIWCRDREIHISADVAYGIWQYWQATGDDDWMRDYGAEIVLDTAVFWMSRVEWNNQFERYELREVIGADEYHEHVNNNAFTNRMAQWHLEKAIVVYNWLQTHVPEKAAELDQKLDLTPERRQRWQDIVTHLWIPYHKETGFIEQYEGFCHLEDIDLQTYEPRTESMQAILGIDGANRRQVLKQPDVLMLLYLMRQLQEFPYDPEHLKTNWNYYAPRTDITYGSSLGPAIHAILAADMGESNLAYQHFLQAALVDLENTRGNATEGIHGACAGGVWQAIVFGFAGIRFEEDRPIATAHLPSHWQRLSFKLHWQGKYYTFDLTPSTAPEAPPPQHDEITRQELALKGVIFDLDGVLTDTAEYHYQAWQQLANEEGLSFDRLANEALRGISRRESLLKIVGDRVYTEPQLEAMMTRKNNHYQQLIESMSPADLLPGALDLLKELKQLGMRTAIGSASKNAQMVVEKLGIRDLIDVIGDGYSVDRPKPAPDLFLYAASQMKLLPTECVVFEDAAAGIEAALAAGMRGVGLGPLERLRNAHIVLPGLAKVQWEDVISKLSLGD